MSDDQRPNTFGFTPAYPIWLRSIAGILVGIGLTIGMFFSAMTFAADQAATFVETTWPRLYKAIRRDAIREVVASGYVYYERGANGTPTVAGRLHLFPSRDIPPFETLKAGYILQAKDGVYIRQGPGSQFDEINVLQGNGCARVETVTSPLARARLKNAESGGWLLVTLVPCPSP